jgi:hypothetical protein
MSSSTLEKRLLPLALATTFLGIVLGAVESITKFLGLIESEFYLLATILYIATMLLVFRIRPSSPRKFNFASRGVRLTIVILGTVIFVLSMGWTYYERHLRTTRPATHPAIKLSQLLPSLEAFITVAHAQESVIKKKGLELEEFYLNDDLCSFTEAETSFSAGGGKQYRTFEFNYEVAQAFQAGKCIGPRGDRPMADVLPILKKHLETKGEKSLINYLGSTEELSRIIRKRGDIFQEVMFTSDELTETKRIAPGDYNVIKEWLLSCVGVYQPVITFVLKNSGTTAVTLTEVVYEIEDVGQVKGGVSGAIYPEETYDHTLDHQKGEQRRQLKPPFRINPGDNGSFNLRLFSSEKAPGLTWLLRIKFIASNGTSVSTGPFQIIMSKF